MKPIILAISAVAASVGAPAAYAQQTWPLNGPDPRGYLKKAEGSVLELGTPTPQASDSGHLVFALPLTPCGLWPKSKPQL